MMEAQIAAALKEHLPYELDMLEGSFVRLYSTEFADQLKDTVIKNALIEAFWTHARNLVEYFMHSKGDRFSGVVSARDFTNDYFPDMKMKTLDQEINAQISHLTYDRKTIEHEKLGGYQMLRVKQSIDRETKRFQELLKPEYRAIWVPRVPSEWIETPSIMSATNTSTVAKSMAGPTGPLHHRS